MHISVEQRPGAAVARVRMQRGESLTCEHGAFIAMSPQIKAEVTSKARQSGGGGIMKGLKRLFSGESFFLNHFTAEADEQELFVGPALIGDVCVHDLRGGEFLVQAGSWVASGPGVAVDTAWLGASAGFLSGEGLFWVKLTGAGPVIMNSFGAIYEVQVDGEYIVDTGHVVALESTLKLEIGKATDGWITSFMSGEALVCKIRGKGKLYCQTHNPSSFGGVLGPLLKPRNA